MGAIKHSIHYIYVRCGAHLKLWYRLLAFGYAIPYRPVEDLAFDVACFYETGGTFQNYYMYFGGTNFGRKAGGPLTATSYEYDAPLDEYGNL